MFGLISLVEMHGPRAQANPSRRNEPGGISQSVGDYVALFVPVSVF